MSKSPIAVRLKTILVTDPARLIASLSRRMPGSTPMMMATGTSQTGGRLGAPLGGLRTTKMTNETTARISATNWAFIRVLLPAHGQTQGGSHVQALGGDVEPCGQRQTAQRICQGQTTAH
jgi:hypothetical protein